MNFLRDMLCDNLQDLEYFRFLNPCGAARLLKCQYLAKILPQLQTVISRELEQIKLPNQIHSTGKDLIFRFRFQKQRPMRPSHPDRARCPPIPPGPTLLL